MYENIYNEICLLHSILKILFLFIWLFSSPHFQYKFHFDPNGFLLFSLSVFVRFCIKFLCKNIIFTMLIIKHHLICMLLFLILKLITSICNKRTKTLFHFILELESICPFSVLFYYDSKTMKDTRMLVHVSWKRCLGKKHRTREFGSEKKNTSISRIVKPMLLVVEVKKRKQHS